MQYFLILIGIALFFILWTLIEQKSLVVSDFEINKSDLPHSFHNTKIIVLADLHNAAFGRNNERLVRRIKSLKPDFIVVAGDMISKSSPCYPSNAYVLLEELSRTYKIYYGYGNHEQRNERLLLETCSQKHMNSRYEYMVLQKYQEQELLSSTWVEYKEELLRNGVTFLDNESVELIKGQDRIKISGVSIAKDFFTRSKAPIMEEGYLSSLIGEKSQDYYHILIAHNPVYFKEYVAWGADLIISGHLHGGMVRIPGIGGVISPQVKLFPKYDAGIYSENGSSMIVSRGLGSHSMMPRYFNTPEIVQIMLKRS